MPYTPSLADLPESQTTSGYTPSLADITDATTSATASALAEAPPVQNNPDIVGRVAGDIDTGALNAVRGLINAPSNIGNMVASAINPAYANTFAPLTDVPGNLINKGLGAINSGMSNTVPAVSQMNFGANLGIPNPNLADSAVQGAAQYAPYALLAPEMLASSGLQAATSAGRAAQVGGLFGATQSQNPAIGAAVGSVANVGADLLGSGIAAIPGWAKNYVSQYMAPQLAKNITTNLNAAKVINNQQAFDLAKQNFANMTTRENTAWDNLSTLAKQLDTPLATSPDAIASSSTMPSVRTGTAPVSNTILPSQLAIGNPSTALTPITKNIGAPNQPEILPPLNNGNNAAPVDGKTVISTYNKYPFDNSNYTSALQNKINFLQNQANNQSGYARANNSSINLLNDYLGDQHSTFSDAIDHNKALNQDYQNEIAPGQPLPFRTVNYAKNNIQNTIQQNIDQHGLDDTLGIAWDNANTITATKNQLFNQVVNNSGKPTISNFSGLLNGKSQFQDPSVFINDYLPKSRGDGIQKMQQLGQMLGDKTVANNVIKQNYFDSAYSNPGASGSVDPTKFLAKYNALSPEQQNYLFQPQENMQARALNNILERNPNALNKGTSAILTHSLPAILGLGLGEETGHMIAGGLAGVIAPYLISKGISTAVKTPRGINYFTNYLNAPRGLNQNITSPYLQGATTPNAVKTTGN